jgi:uncharacterized protein YacL
VQNRQLLISDANILIDMDVGGLLEVMFRLDFAFAVPDILFEEELKSRHPRLPDLGLGILELTAEMIDDATRLIVRYGHRRTSRNDLLTLALARQRRGLVLTGDADLRLVCNEQGIDVHGTIWLVEQMLNGRLVDFETVAGAYRDMREGGSRLPWRDVDQQLDRFRG